jgi:hypothetical protein
MLPSRWAQLVCRNIDVKIDTLAGTHCRSAGNVALPISTAGMAPSAMSAWRAIAALLVNCHR